MMAEKQDCRVDTSLMERALGQKVRSNPEGSTDLVMVGSTHP